MRILLLAYETEGCSMAALAEQLREEGHEPLVAHCDYYNFIDDNHIKSFYQNRGFTDWVNFADEYENLYSGNWSVDWDYLRNFESTYCDSKNLKQLVMSDPLLSREHHFRFPYMTPIRSREQVLCWTESMLRWIIGLLDDFDPDLVFTYRRNYFIKNAVAQISASTELPMFTLLRSRIDDYCHISTEFGLGTDTQVEHRLQNEETWETVADGRSYVKEFREGSDTGGLYGARSQQRIEHKKLFTLPEIGKEFAKNVASLGLKSLRREKRKYRGRFFAKNYFNSHRPSVVGFHTRIAYNRLKYRLKNPFTSELPKQPFVYVPLHTLPESSTLTLSTEYYEPDLIRFIAKELPIEFEIAVKENPNMVGTRPFSYYEELKRNPRVRLLDPKIQSKRLIREANGVCGISGTALLEATMLDTPTHYFGCPEFDAVLEYKGHSEFDQFADACAKGVGTKRPELVERYVQYILEEGQEIPLRSVRTDPGSKEWRKGTEQIFNLLKDAIERREL
jgi:hypothetical protein